MATSSGGVPPGFRFHPTDEELLHYYLKKKISFQKFDMDVIREIDLNKIEPWDLQERCKIGSTPQNEWYFFSHKDRKYPTGSRTNRATNAGFWKATGRDKCIRNTFKKIGMRKTLVFYRGRAPHGQKTDWIMHEYRLEDGGDHQDPLTGNPNSSEQEDGWVICRVFKKKNLFKVGGNDQGSGNCSGGGLVATMGSSDQLNNLANQPPRMFAHSLNRETNHPYLLHHHHHQQQQQQQEFVDLGLNYTHIPHVPLPHYPHLQAQNFIPTHKPLGGGYVVDDFSATLPSDNSPIMVRQLIPNPRDQCDSGGSDQHNQLSIYNNQCGDQEPPVPGGGGLEQQDVDNNCEANSQSMNDHDQWGVVDHHRLVETSHLGHDHHQDSSTKGVVGFEEVNPPPPPPPSSSSSMHQINQLSLRGGMDFWGYGK